MPRYGFSGQFKAWVEAEDEQAAREWLNSSPGDCIIDFEIMDFEEE